MTARKKSTTEHVVLVGVKGGNWKISARGKLLPKIYPWLDDAHDAARIKFPNSIISVQEYKPF